MRTLITSDLKYDYRGLTSSYLITELIWSVNSPDMNMIPLLQMVIVMTLHFGAQIIAEKESLMYQGDGSEIILSVEDEENPIAKDPRLWFNFSNNNVVYWIVYGPNNCQHHKSLANILIVANL